MRAFITIMIPFFSFIVALMVMDKVPLNPDVFLCALGFFITLCGVTVAVTGACLMMGVVS